MKTRFKPLTWVVLTSLFWIALWAYTGYEYEYNLFTNTFPCQN